MREKLNEGVGPIVDIFGRNSKREWALSPMREKLNNGEGPMVDIFGRN